MELPESLLTVFSAKVEHRGGAPVVELPQRELDLGELQAGESYRIAVFPQPETSTESTDEAPRRDDQRRSRNTSEPPVEEGEQCEVEIEDVGEQGDGIARVGPGYVVFVPETDVGDRVTVEITKAQDNYAFAEVIEGEPLSG
ncbi:deoxyribonuclease [Halobacteriales archaeon QS_1_68_20]|nr:MAG: deoxyribonuclease [Halobacteriales archaeon QS_1_68_20]